MYENLIYPPRTSDEITPSDITIFVFTDRGQRKYSHGVPVAQMSHPLDYRIKVITYKQWEEQRVLIELGEPKESGFHRKYTSPKLVHRVQHDKENTGLQKDYTSGAQDKSIKYKKMSQVLKKIGFDLYTIKWYKKHPDPDALDSKVSTMYRERAKQFHPDTHPDKVVEMSELNEAMSRYKILAPRYRASQHDDAMYHLAR